MDEHGCLKETVAETSQELIRCWRIGEPSEWFLWFILERLCIHT